MASVNLRVLSYGAYRPLRIVITAAAGLNSADIRTEAVAGPPDHAECYQARPGSSTIEVISSVIPSSCIPPYTSSGTAMWLL
jgi:hypothetical protein